MSQRVETGTFCLSEGDVRLPPSFLLLLPPHRLYLSEEATLPRIQERRVDFVSLSLCPVPEHRELQERQSPDREKESCKTKNERSRAQLTSQNSVVLPPRLCCCTMSLVDLLTNVEVGSTGTCKNHRGKGSASGEGRRKEGREEGVLGGRTDEKRSPSDGLRDIERSVRESVQQRRKER